MFSSFSRNQKQQLGATRVAADETIKNGDALNTKAVPLSATVSKRWIRFMKRERQDVIARFLSWRGEQSGAAEITLDVRRPAQNGQPYHRRWLFDRQSGCVRVAEVPR